MDDTPGHFVHELRSSLLRKRAGQIALAVILAEASLRFLNALTWYLVVPTIAALLKGHTESVLFETQTRAPFPWQPLFGSVLDFAIALIFVFYLNRWIHGSSAEDAMRQAGSDGLGPPETEVRPLQSAPDRPREVLYNLVGERVSPEDDETLRG
jgi:large-conductance mechanosensitive channel